jgi:hypothetical protein
MTAILQIFPLSALFSLNIQQTIGKILNKITKSIIQFFFSPCERCFSDAFQKQLAKIIATAKRCKQQRLLQ